MKRFVLGVASGFAIATSALLIAAPGLVNATGPESRQVSDPAVDQGLRVGFAEVSGSFLGEVALIIEDPSGTELINTVVDGPWFFTPLPAGSYNVRAVFNDQEKQIKGVRLAEKKVTEMVMYWDLNIPATQMMASVGALGLP